VRHKHYWFVVHAVYGAAADGYRVVRYCECGARQLGHVTKWVRLAKGHDANHEIDERGSHE
jgi:hypothetical protein